VASLAGSVSTKTIKKYLYSVGVVCVEHGCANPVYEPLVERVVRGVKRTYGTAPRRERLPITTGVLSKIRPFFDFSRREERVYWAAGCTGTYALLRAGEFTAATRLSDTFLRQCDWTRVSSRIARLHLVASKTDPYRHGVDITIAANDSPTDPLSAMSAVEELTPADASAPLFMMDNGSPLARDQLIRRFRSALAAAGLNADSYNGHSFRKGGAQSLALARVPDHAIKVLGRWASDSYRLYIGLTASQFAAYSSAIGALPPGTDLPISA
jgi:hypothetical protein